VLEDRSLLRELAARERGERASRVTQAREVARYVGWNAARMITRRWQRYGRAAVTLGRPIRVQDWLEERQRVGIDVFQLPRPERLAQVQFLCDRVMSRIGDIIPVTAVPLACAAIQSFDGHFITRDALLARMSEMRSVLLELNAKVLRADRDIGETFDRAWRMLSMRRILAAEGDGFAVLPAGRPLVSYYANSISHVLGPFAGGVRQRDSLPVQVAMGEWLE
jgi:glycerol-3-phosphate O-acyltransferase